MQRLLSPDFDEECMEIEGGFRVNVMSIFLKACFDQNILTVYKIKKIHL